MEKENIIPMSFPCKYLVTHEVLDVCPQEKKELQIECESEVRNVNVTIKKEGTTDDHVEHYNGDDNSELQSETKESSISTQRVKQECFTKDLEETKQNFIPCKSVKVEHIFQCSAESLVDNGHDPLAINDIKIERVKKEYTFTGAIKEDLAIGIKGEQKYEDIKYNIDVVEHKVGCPVDNNLTSVKSTSDDSAPSTSRQDVLVSGKQDPSLLEDKQIKRKQKYITSMKANKKGSNDAECSKCHKTFSSAGNLKRHADVMHKGIKNFECHECHKMFLHSCSLKAHINTVHLEIKKFKCNECCKMFSTLAKLKRHVKGVHLKIKDFECKDCNKTFLYVTSFRRHINIIHNGVQLKKYGCKYCHKRFSGGTSCKTHIDIIHKGIKNFTCNICSKIFTQASHLTQHLAIHKGIRFECYDCHKTFSRKYTLEMHINIIHKRIKNFECYDCHKYFSRFDALKTHINRHHHHYEQFPAIV